MAGRRGLLGFAATGIGGLYLAAVAGMFFAQGRLVFPSWAVPPSGPLRPGAERLTVELPDAARLEGVHIPARHTPTSDTLLLVFPGNATNAQAMAEFIADILPDHPVVSFHYRGYPPSTGASAGRHLLADAPFIYDLAVERYRPRRLIAVGQSLGSGVAAGLSRERALAGLVLITPFDSLREVARQAQPLLPVSWLFRHDMDSAAALRAAPVPTAIIAGARDTLVRPERTDRLRAAASRLVLDETFAEAVHNDVHLHPRFVPALRESIRRIEAEDGRS